MKPNKTDMSKQEEEDLSIREVEQPEEGGEDSQQAKGKEEEAKNILQRFTDTDEESERPNVSLRTILGGDILAGRWFRRQFPFIVMVVVFIILYVSNRYASQQELLEIDALQEQRINEQYKALTRSSEWMERTRRSYVENYLRETHDSTLQTATTPPFSLNINED